MGSEAHILDSAWVMYTLPPAAQRWAPVPGAKPAKCMNPGHPHQMGHPRWNLRGGGDRNTLKEAARTFRSRGYELNSARSAPAPHACAHTCKPRPTPSASHAHTPVQICALEVVRRPLKRGPGQPVGAGGAIRSVPTALAQTGTGGGKGVQHARNRRCRVCLAAAVHSRPLSE